jgi:LysM repeat protein
MAYLRELNISSHPLFDLYFLQIYHAQTVGFGNLASVRRELVSVGVSTYESIRRWRGSLTRRYQSSFDFPSQQPNNTDAQFVLSSRNFLRQFVVNYFRQRWVPIITAATSIVIDLVLTIPQSGGVGWQDVGFAVVSFYSADLILRATVNSPPNLPVESRMSLIFVGIILIVIMFMITIAPKMLSSAAKLISFSSFTPTITPGFSNVAQQLQTPVPLLGTTQEVLIPTSTVTAISVSTFFAVNSLPTTQSSDIGYCSYVVQPGDTVQTLASRFQISEGDLYTNNRFITSDTLMISRSVYINAPCCRPIGNNGFSYTVQRGETLYSIAKRYGQSVERLATVNNLFNPRYIQAGQMLCVPYP